MKHYFAAVRRPIDGIAQVSPAMHLVRPIPEARSIRAYSADIPAFTTPTSERDVLSAWRPSGKCGIYSERNGPHCLVFKRPDSEHLLCSFNGGIDNTSVRGIKACLPRRFIAGGYGCDRARFAIENLDRQSMLRQTM